MKIRLALVLLACGFLVVGTTSFAQVSTSRIGGTVTDSTGAVIPGAKVTATNEATGITYETTTTEGGVYSFAALVVGSYTISVETAGFKKFVSSKNELNVGSPLVVNAALEIGEVTSVINVESSAERLKTSDAMISDVIDRRAIRDLPLNGRNPLNLITLEPGLIQRGSAARGSGTHINGSRDRAFNVTLDGIDANEPSVPNPQSNTFRVTTDNIQEYRIVTHNATAEFGRSSGANIALASRSGTNEFHGNVYEYFRNPVLNARDFFINRPAVNPPGTTALKPDFKVHQFGADVGGPIIRDKTHFAFSWQTTRLGFTQPITEVFGTPIVYTASARMGIYRFVRGTVTPTGGSPITANAPGLVDATGNLLPGIATCGGAVTTNCIDQYNISTNNPSVGTFPLDPAMMTYFGDMPLPNNFGSGDGLNTAAFFWNPPSSQPELRFQFRVDHQFNENNSIFGRFTWANSDTKDGDFLNSRPQVFPGYPPRGLVDRRPRNLALSYRRVFTPKLVNEFTAGYSRFLFDFLFGRANPDFPNIPPFNSPNVSEPFNAQSGTARWLTTIQYIDNLSYTTGNHLFRGGINFRFVQHNDQRSFVGAVNNAPSVVFSSTRVTTAAFPNIPGVFNSTSAPNGIKSADLTRLRNMMSDMLGLPASITQSYFTSGLNDYTPSGLYVRGVRYHQYNYYVQDEWKWRPNFTVNLGLRWEWNRPAAEANDLILRPNSPLDGSQGPVSFVARKTFWDRENATSLAPRIGFAWDPFSKGKTVVRVGYGIMFDVISTFQMVPVLGLVPGSSAFCSVGISSTSTGAGLDAPSANCASPSGILSTVAGGFPASLPPPTVPPSTFASPAIQRAGAAPPTGAIDPDLQNPTVHEWTLNVQHDLGKDVILQVGYLGKRGTHLFNAYDLNQVKLPSSFLTSFNIARNNLMIGCDADGTVAGSSTSPCAIAGAAVPTLLNQIVCGVAATTCTGVNGTTVVPRLISNAAGSLADVLDTGSTFSQSFNNMLAIPGVGPDFFRTNPQFDLMFFFDNSADSYYHALQIQLRRQAQNLGFGASYTFGKSIDTASTDPVGATSGGNVGNNSGTYTDIRNFAVDRGRSDFDRTHSFVGHVIYDLPFGRGQRYAADVPGWLNQLVGGWTGTSIVTITSGEPWSVLSGQFTNGNIRASRADILQRPPTGIFHNVSGVDGPTVFSQDVLQNLSTYFAIPAPGSNGNSGRNIFTGPSYWNVDLGITKQFNVTERIDLQFRAEMFNVFNHPNFDNPLTSTDGVTSAFAGNSSTFQSPNADFARVCCTAVTTASTSSLISVGEAARVIQFALRLNF